jgi:hypothetical protein
LGVGIGIADAADEVEGDHADRQEKTDQHGVDAGVEGVGEEAGLGGVGFAGAGDGVFAHGAGMR